jgi:predicted transcriptional regulator
MSSAVMTNRASLGVFSEIVETLRGAGPGDTAMTNRRWLAAAVCFYTRAIGDWDMRTRGFGDLEAVIMDRIWDRDAPTTTVRDIFNELTAEREIAYTTVMSTMDNLHNKGWLAREKDGKAYRYWPTLTREQHSARLMRAALDGGGRSELVLNHFVEQIGPEESDRLRAALRRIAARSRRATK